MRKPRDSLDSTLARLLLRVLGLCWACGRSQPMGGASNSCPESCYCFHDGDVGVVVRCSSASLLSVPQNLPNRTHRLYLDHNLLETVPSDAFLQLPLLSELDLSHNRLERLEPGAFRDVAESLSSLDLSCNQLETLEAEALAEVRAHTNLSHNPWLCDCRLQAAVSRLRLEPSSLAGVVCNDSAPDTPGVRGVPLLLLPPDLDLCAARRRTTDRVMLLTMFVWFAMVTAFLVYYVKHNQDEARRHLEYLKSLPNRQGHADQGVAEGVAQGVARGGDKVHCV